MCSPPLSTCQMGPSETYCADFLRDRYNCGGCNIVCPQAEDGCFDGKCGATPPPPTCGPPRMICQITPMMTACVDVTRDPYHCGGCGQPCPAGSPCQDGRCLTP